MPLATLHRDGAVSVVTLNRSERLNAIGLPLLTDLHAALQAAQQDVDTRTIVLTGAGRAFCAGADLKDGAGEGTAADLGARMADAFQRITRAIVGGPKLVVGAVHGYAVGGGLEWRSRVDAGFSKIPGQQLNGLAFYQDLIYQSIGSPWSFSTRFALFDTDGYAIRFYAYERDVLSDFSIPAFYDRGSRFYLNAGYRLSRQWRLEARFARTWYSNQETIGSGLEEIAGPSRSDVKFQVRWEF